MAINWELGVAPDIIGNALNGLAEGRKDKAFSSLVANPSDPNALATYARYDPRGAMAFQQQQSKAAADKLAAEDAAKKRQTEMVKQTASILRQVKADPSKYPLARQAAIQLGVPAESIPEQYDPNWISQQDMIYTAFEKDGGVTLTNAAKQVGELGYDINTPQGKAVLAQLINADNSKPYVDESGRQRLYTGFNVAPNAMDAPSAPAGPPPQKEPFTFEMFQSFGSPEGAAAYVKKYNYRVTVQTPQQARQLPSGTPITLPDGSEGVVP